MKNEPLYLRVYNYYKELISSGKLTAGAKLPSIRRCAQELEVSRTTVEAAYLQLAAEGYVVAKPQSGFYASSLEYPLEPGGAAGFSHGLHQPRLNTGMILRPLPWMRKALISRCGDGISKAPYGQTGGYSPMASRRASPISAQRFAAMWQKAATWCALRSKLWLAQVYRAFCISCVDCWMSGRQSVFGTMHLHRGAPFLKTTAFQCIIMCKEGMNLRHWNGIISACYIVPLPIWTRWATSCRWRKG